MCSHRRIKRNYPFGRKSRPRLSCKDCGRYLRSKDLPKKPKKQRRNYEHPRNTKKNK